ncbi:MAG: LL-diaminopimelate aminotransferase [Clostridia bacterium]|nr:LL-diaminopimelate aminotransferase [Clostridia bacterium]
MVKVNENYSNIKETYLFTETARKIKSFSQKNPDVNVIKLSIGDVTRPLVNSVVDSMGKAVEEMRHMETFKGYGPEQGYTFLKEKIQNYYKTQMGVNLDINDIFISDGAKSDLGNITDIFSNDNVIGVTDPVYPVYVDSNIMCGRKIVYLKADETNNFLPMPNENIKADIFYLCSPNNPTGAVYSYDQLKIWVDYANRNKSIILFDAAYERFVKTNNPRSIFEIEGSKTCAIEFCSFSKTAGFTGTRCGYTVVPKELIVGEYCLNKMWLRRQTTKFNGVSYVVQKAAEAVFTNEGAKEIDETINYYRENARIIVDTLSRLNIKFYGGINSPYIWFEVPKEFTSWEFFDYLLENAGVAGTPGSGFGECGEGYFRITSFNTHDNTKIAMERIEKLFKK